MSRNSKGRVSVEGGDGLANDVFDGLNLGALPDGPASSPSLYARAQGKKVMSLGRVEVRREKAGRGGKTVTTLRAFRAGTAVKELDSLLFDLKKSCACGGTLKLGVIELQGDVCERVIGELQRRGYQPVRAGG